jgi:hypothetical protein
MKIAKCVLNIVLLVIVTNVHNAIMKRITKKTYWDFESTILR